METNSETNVKRELEKLYFHDSSFRSIQLQFSDDGDRTCALEIDYYDWEGNGLRRKKTPDAKWEWKSVTIHFGFVAVFEYSAPDLNNRARDIDEVEFDYRLEELRVKEQSYLKQFPGYCSPLFGDKLEPISIKFKTQNNDENSDGYILVIGNDVKMTWGNFMPNSGQIHFPIKTE
jgi:hypothetical protein